mmetsp:Transcript_2555/g.7667  ORF Transcript_2555/g.7667 Transcript_2555/m.7667 type:complete len:229 (+) Transcript_2555:130-816(+)
MYYAAVPASFALFTGLFLASFYLNGAMVEKSCSRVSAFHHFVAMLLGFWAHWKYLGSIEEDASFGANHEFPHAVLLQHFNIGYFLYDTVHVAVWDQKFILHHLVAIAGYTTSELGNVFALANAVNTWITELGSLMYSAYLVFRTDSAYLAFVALYTLSRAYFAVWSCQVLGQVWAALQLSPERRSFPPWAPYCAATLQVLLLVVNISFMATHYRKLWKRYGPGAAKHT